MKFSPLALFSLLMVVSCVQPAAVENKLDTSVEKPCEMSSTAESLNDPQTIKELTNLINALPKPLKLECLIKSLKRPLMVNATSSTSSAQPADTIHNPRIFIFKGDLIISIVPQGEGSSLLEFSELLSDTRSVKGELTLPITGNVEEKTPFARISNGTRTTCSACHSSETPEYMVDDTQVFSSVAIKPGVSMDVTVYDLKYELYLCQFHNSPANRCKVLDALLSNGDVQQTAFPASMPTFQNSF